MCDCCGQVFDIDHINPVDEEIVDSDGETVKPSLPKMIFAMNV